MALTADQYETRKAAAGPGDPRPVDGCRWCSAHTNFKPGPPSCSTCVDLSNNHGWTAGTYAQMEVWYRKEGQGQIRNTVEFIRASTGDVAASRRREPMDEDAAGGNVDEDEVDARQRVERCYKLLEELKSLAKEVCVGRDDGKWAALEAEFAACCDPSNGNFIENGSEYYAAALEATEEEYRADREKYKEAEGKLNALRAELKCGREKRFEIARYHTHQLLLSRHQYQRDKNIEEANEELSEKREQLEKAQRLLNADREYLRNYEGESSDTIVNGMKAQIQQKEAQIEKIRKVISDKEKALFDHLAECLKKRKHQFGVTDPAEKPKYQTPEKARKAHDASGLGRPIGLKKGNAEAGSEGTGTAGDE